MNLVNGKMINNSLVGEESNDGNGRTRNGRSRRRSGRKTESSARNNRTMRRSRSKLINNGTISKRSPDNVWNLSKIKQKYETRPSVTTIPWTGLCSNMEKLNARLSMDENDDETRIAKGKVPTRFSAPYINKLARELKTYGKLLEKTIRGNDNKECVKHLRGCKFILRKLMSDEIEFSRIIRSSGKEEWMWGIISNLLNTCESLMNVKYYASLKLYTLFDDVYDSEKCDRITFGQENMDRTNFKKAYSLFQSIWSAWSLCLNVQVVLCRVDKKLETVTSSHLFDRYESRGTRLPVDNSGHPMPICHYNLREIICVVNMLRKTYTSREPDEKVNEIIKCLRMRCMILSCKKFNRATLNDDKYVTSERKVENVDIQQNVAVTPTSSDVQRESAKSLIRESDTVSNSGGNKRADLGNIYSVNGRFVYEICAALIWFNREYYHFKENVLNYSTKSKDKYESLFVENGINMSEAYVKLPTMVDYLTKMSTRYIGEEFNIEFTRDCYDRYCDYVDFLSYALLCRAYESDVSVYTVLNMTKHSMIADKQNIMGKLNGRSLEGLMANTLEWNVLVMVLFSKVLKSMCDFEMSKECHYYIKGNRSSICGYVCARITHFGKVKLGLLIK